MAAPEPSGMVVAVIQQADALSTSFGKRNLEPATAVYLGDKILTGPIGEAQLRFRDQTKMVVGPNSQLLIDNFVYAGGGKAQDVSINAVRGTFRFITGNSAKTAYSLKTPVATIGVRGTQFDFSVAPSGRMDFVLYEGSATICSNSGGCLKLTGSCSVAMVPPGGPAKRIGKRTERQNVLDTAFPYLKEQARLQPGFRAEIGNCSTQKAFVPPVDGFANGGGNGGSVSGVNLTPVSTVSIITRPAPPPPPPPSGPSCGPHGGWSGHGGSQGGEGGGDTY